MACWLRVLIALGEDPSKFPLRTSGSTQPTILVSGNPAPSSGIHDLHTCVHNHSSLYSHIGK